jgi:hypothetical protein
MSYEPNIQGLKDQMKDLNSKIEALIAITVDTKPAKSRRSRVNRSNSLAASVTDEERDAVDKLCTELCEKNGWRLTRSALLRVAWLHFLDNHENYDLEPYMD